MKYLLNCRILVCNFSNLLCIEFTKVLQKAAEAASGTLIATITINIVLSIVLGVSMKRLWTMINTIQIITHYPMQSISYPSNALLCFKSIVDVANMNIIPKAYIKKVLSSIVVDSSNGVKESFKLMDIFKTHTDLFIS